MTAVGPSTIRIDDPDDPRIALYRDLKDRWLIARTGAEDDPSRFIAEGERVARVLFESRYETESVLAIGSRLEAIAGDLARLPASTRIYEASRSVLKAITGFDVHRGLLAMGLREPLPGLDRILSDARACVVLEDLSNHDNIGGLFRTVAALAGAGCPILLTPSCADPLYRKAIRVSMGQALRVPWTRTGDWPESIGALESLGFEPLALTPAADAEPIGTFQPTPGKRPALLLGAEGPGLAEVTMQRCRKVRIPIDPAADSLNVNVAGAVALHRLVEPITS